MDAPPLSPVPAERTKWVPLINRSFARLWSGQVVTDLGTVVVNAAANVAMMPLLLGATPRALVGRMNALFFTALTVTSLLSSTVAGWLDSDVLRGFSMTLLGMRFGPVDTLLTLARLLICASGVYAAVELPMR